MPAQEDDSPQVKKLYDLQDRARALNERSLDEEPTKGELIAFFTLTGLAISGVAAVVVASIKQQKKELEEERALEEKRMRSLQEFEDWVTEQENIGKNVYELADGRFLTVDRSAEQTKYTKRF